MAAWTNGSLLERERELGHLEEALARAKDGVGKLILIEGPPGIGKSRLLAATRAHASEQGLQVLSGRGSELERDFSFGVVRQLFEPVIGSTGSEGRSPLLSGAARHVDLLFNPKMDDVPVLAADRLFTVLHGLFWLAANIADEQPLLLSVDDLHWCDATSLRFLDFLGNRVESIGIVVVATRRLEDPGTDPLLLDSLGSGPLTARLQPAPLSEEGSDNLLREVLGPDCDADFCRACHQATKGNPLLLRELARVVETECIHPIAANAQTAIDLGAKAVGYALGLRLARAGHEAERLAMAAAVFGSGCSLRDATVLAGLSESSSHAAVETLSRLDILKIEPVIEFIHPLVRSAVYTRIPFTERQRLHGVAAQMLADAGRPQQQVAAHIWLATPGSFRRAAEVLREAARLSLRSGDARAAASYLRRVLEEPVTDRERAEVLFELGSAETLVDGRAAAANLADALHATVDPGRRAVAADLLARSLVFVGRSQEAFDIGQRAIEELRDEHPDLRRELEATVLAIAIHEPTFKHVMASLRRTAATEKGEDFGSKALLATLSLLDAREVASPANEVVALAKLALRGGLLLDRDNGGLTMIAAGLSLTMADSDLARRHYETGLAAAEEQGSIFALAANKIFRSQVHLVRGELVEALGDAQEGLDASNTFGIAIGAPWATAFLASTLVERGDLEGAEQSLAQADPGGEIPQNWHWIQYREARARLLMARGDSRGALAETEESATFLEDLGVRNPAFTGWRSRAALCLTFLDERRDDARRLVNEELELARTWGTRRTVGTALRATGLVTGGASGLELLEQAANELERSPARLEFARASIDLGSALRRSNRRLEARGPLQLGMDVAHGCGADALEEHARQELRATGARPRRAAVTGASALTPSEERVARMAAEGMRNRDIAQKLFVTPKTVEVHLSNAYRKLGITSRSELASALTG